MAISQYGFINTAYSAKNKDGHTIGAFGTSGYTGRKQIPDKVSGVLVTLPGGTRFRKSTDYSRFDFHMETEAQQHSVGINSFGYPYDYVEATSTGGGYGCHETFIDFNSANTFSSPLGAFNGNYFPQIPQGMRNEAVTKALLKIADQKVNLGENLATLGQTVRLFAGVTKTLVDSLSAAYRDKSLRPYLLKSLAQIRREGVSKVIAGKYLEYVYGWKPLVGDVYALYELARHGFEQTLILHGQGHSKQQGRAEEKIFNNVSIRSQTVQTFVEERCRVNCHLWARLDPEWQGARAFNQLGLLNPVSLAWELVPWSFVVDWVLPIGSVLSALSAPAGLIFIDGSLSARTSAEGPYTQVCFWPGYSNDSWNAVNQHATGSCHYEGYVRQHLTDWPLPGFWIDSDPLRGDRIFKALALAIANLGGMRTSTLG